MFVMSPSDEPDFLHFFIIVSNLPCIGEILLDEVQLQRCQVRHRFVDCILEKKVCGVYVLAEADKGKVCHGHVRLDVDWRLGALVVERIVDIRGQLLEDCQRIVSLVLKKTNSDHTHLQFVVKLFIGTLGVFDLLIHFPDFVKIEIARFHEEWEDGTQNRFGGEQMVQ